MRGGKAVDACGGLARAHNVSIPHDVIHPSCRIQDGLKPRGGDGDLAAAFGDMDLRMALGDGAAGVIVLVQQD